VGVQAQAEDAAYREQEGVGGRAGEGEGGWEDELEGRGCDFGGVKPCARSCLQSQVQSQVNSQPAESRRATGRSASSSFKAGGPVRFGRLEMSDEKILEALQKIWQLHSSPDVLLLNPEPRKVLTDSTAVAAHL